MKKLILIGGPRGVGKSEVCRYLQEYLPNYAYLDGDWCWNMRPFVDTEATRAMAMDNICDILGRCIALSLHDHILFCWELRRQEVIDEILGRLDLSDVKVYNYSLMAPAHVVKGRLMGDVLRGVRDAELVKRSEACIEDYLRLNTVKIETDHIKPREIARGIAKRILR